VKEVELLDVDGTVKYKTMGYVSHAQRKAVWASKKDGGKGNPNKKSPAKMNGKKSDTLYLPNKFKKHQNKMIDETDYDDLSKKIENYNRKSVEDLQDLGKIKLNKKGKPYVVNRKN